MQFKKRKQNLISLKEASEIFGYASDYIGYLIRKEKIPGKKIQSETMWKVSREAILDYLNKRKNQKVSYPKRWQSLIRKEYISLKEAGKISGFAPDYIGYLIRNGKVPGKKIYSGIFWMTTEEAIRQYQKLKKKGRKGFDFPLRVSKFALVTAVLGIIIFGGLFVFAISPKNQIQTIEIYPLQIQSDTGVEEVGLSTKEMSWQNVQNVKGLPEVRFDGDLDSFSETNSAFYQQGPSSLILADFKTTQADLDTGKISKEKPIEELIEEPIEEPTEEFVSTSTETIESTSTETENQPQLEETPIQEELPGQDQDGSLTSTETIDIENEIIDDTTTTETNEPVSFFEKIKNFFEKKIVRAEETPAFEKLTQNNEFLSAEIKFSFAIGEKTTDLQIIEQQETEEGAGPSTSSEPVSFWQKVKNFFNNLVQKTILIVRAEESTTTIPSPETPTSTSDINDEIILPEAAMTETTTATTTEVLSNLDAKIIIWWSLDGQNWQQLDTIYDEPLSNDVNGGYFTFDAPFLKNWEDVKNLKIKFEGVVGNETVVTAYLDSIWVEAEYQEKRDDEFELKPLKKDWRADEIPTFEIVSKKEENIIENLIAQVPSIFEEKPKIGADLIKPDKEILSLQEGEDFKSETHSPTKIEIFKPEDFRPGKYSLKIDFEKNGKIYNLEQDFTWGVLAINVNKSIYVSDKQQETSDQAYIQMAALRDDGHTVCDANLKLEIISPSGESSFPEIQKSGRCGPNNVTDVPDYFAYYSFGVMREGEYQMKLTNLDNGYEITDSFEVREHVPFDVERIGPTRIYPPASYEMTMKIKVNQDFEGQVKEPVPASFEILETSDKRQEIKNGEKNIIWDVNWKAGEAYELKYQFDAPDVNPYLYLLGPLEFYSDKQQETSDKPQGVIEKIKEGIEDLLGSTSEVFREIRAWQIASDAPAAISHFIARRVAEQTKTVAGWSAVTGTAESGTNASPNGWIDDTNFTVGQKYLILIWGYHNISLASNRSGIRVMHGATAFTESQTLEEADRIGAAYKTPYFWFTVWTAVSNEDIEVQFYNDLGTDTASVEDITLIAINAEDLITNNDLKYNISTAGGTLDTTFTSKASITWTPAINNDTWWTGAYVQGDTVDIDTDQLEARLNIDSGTIRSSYSIEGEDTADTPLYGLGWAQQFSNTSHSVAVEIREDAADMEWDSTGVFALRLNAFEDFAVATTSSYTLSAGLNLYNQIATVTPTPTRTGKWLVVGGFIADDNNGRVTARIQESEANITDENGGWQHNAADWIPFTAADISSFTTSTKDIDFDARETSDVTDPVAMDVWLISFSMELVPTSSTFNQSAYRWFNNLDSTSVGPPLAATNTSTKLSSSGQAFRLRTLLHVGNSQLAISGQAFKLQYVGKGTGTCSSPSGGNPSAYTDVQLSGKDWTEATSSAQWAIRNAHTSGVFDNKIFVMGGKNSDGNRNDVWYSTNGVSWTQATSSANWTIRSGHFSVVYDNKIWVMGGWNGGANYNDVWYSIDNGQTWTQATSSAGWAGRRYASAVVYDNKMWVIGGRTDAATYINDVWYSTNGVSWTQATSSAQWSARLAHTSVDFDNKMWVIGGWDAVGGKNDVWYSTNGVSWTQATSSAQWSGRDAHTSVVYDNKIWVMGGDDGVSPYENDVWYSTNGVSWTQATSSAQWSGRLSHTSVVYDNKIWVIGGLVYPSIYKNDVWYSGGYIIFNNNPTPADGDALTATSTDPTHGTDDIVAQTYEELNNFTNSIAAIPAGDDGKWDFALKDNSAPANTTYCFRAVKSDNTALDTYTVYPEITTYGIIVDESFEGTEYEESWTETVGAGNTADEDFPIGEDSNGDLPPGSATESLRLVVNNNQTALETKTSSTTDYAIGVGRWFVNVKSFSITTATSGDYCRIGTIYNSGGSITASPLILWDGSQYVFTFRYYDTSLQNDSGPGYAFSLNTYYRIELKYDYTNKTVDFKVYNLAGTELYTRSITFSGTPRYSAQIGCNITTVSPSTVNRSAEIHYDLVAFDNAIFPIGAETEFSSISTMTLRPNGAGTYTEWSQSSATTSNYLLVNEPTPDDDTTYVYLNNPTSTFKDSYNFQNQSGTLKKILSVKIEIRTRQAATSGYRRENLAENPYIICRTHNTDYFSWSTSKWLIKPGTSYSDFYWELDTNPYTGKPWTWDEIQSAEFGVRGLEDIDGQIRVTQVWAEVIHGSYNHRYPTASPVFGGVATSTIKVFSKSIRPSYVGTSKSSYLKIRYSTSTDLTGYSEYPNSTGTQVASSNDWTNIFTISSLTASTTYYFDILASPDGSTNWISLHDLFSMSYYPESKTSPTENQDADFDFALINDSHGLTSFNIANVGTKNPRFVLTNGDFHDDIQGASADETLQNVRNAMRSMYSGSKLVRTTFWDKMPLVRVWDDHDYYVNDADESAAYKSSSKQGFLEYTPHPNAPTENSSFQYGIWTKFKVANAEFFLWDLRYRRDPNGTTDGDMMDGTGDGNGSGSGHDQRDYMISVINNSTAKWKFVMSSVPWNATCPHSTGAWGDYDPTDSQRTYLVNNITADNVIFLTGDKHHSALDDGTNSNFPEFLMAPFSIASDVQVNETWTKGPYGTSISPNFFGLVKVRGSYVILELYGSDGTLIDSLQVNAAGITISGTVYTNEGTTTSTAGSIVSLVVNGSWTASTTASTSTGAYTFSNVSQPATSTPITVYLDNSSEKGVTVTRYSGSGNLTGLNIYQNRIIARYEDSGPITISDLDKYDYEQDPDILFTAASSTGTLNASSTSEFFVWSGKTFGAYGTGGVGGAISLADVDINGTFTATSTQTISVSCVGNMSCWDATGGTFTCQQGTVTFNATSTGKTITTAGSAFYNLTFNGSGGVWALQDALDINNNATGTAGTLNSNNQNINIGGNLSLASGFTFTKGTGTLTFDTGGTNTWIDNNASKQDMGVVIIGSPAYQTINLGSSVKATKVDVAGYENILGLGSSGYILTITGSGTGSSRPFIVSSGILNEGTNSTVKFTGTSATEIQAETYHHLELSPSGAGSPTYTLGTAVSQTITISGNLYTAVLEQPVTVDWTTYDPALNLSGNLALNPGTTWTKSDTATLTWSPEGTTRTWTDNNSTKQDIGQISILDSLGGIIQLQSGVKATTISIGTGLPPPALQLNNQNLDITGGNLTTTGSGTITCSGCTSGTTTISGTGTIGGGTGSITFYNLSLSGSAATTTLGTAITLLNNMTIGSNRTLDVSGSSYGITVKGNWSNSGKFLCQQGTVTFNATSTGKTISDGGWPFYLLTFNGSGGEWLYQDSTSTAPATTTVIAGTANFLNAKTGAVSVTGGTLNVDWYLGAHLVDKDETSHNIDTGDTDITISENSTTTTTSTESLRPNAAGDSTQFSPSGCTNNYECVDEETADGDTTYVQGGDCDTCFPTFYIAIKENGVTTYATKTLTESYAEYSQQWNTRPSDNGSWTITDINALQIGARALGIVADELDLYNLPSSSIPSGSTINFVKVYVNARNYSLGFVGYARVTQVYVEVDYTYQGQPTVWRHNGTDWGTASTTQTTGSNASGTIPYPGQDGAIRIREYSRTSEITTFYKYNLAVVSQPGFLVYNYYSNYGNNYLTSTSSLESSGVDKVIYANWHRANISQMNTPYSAVNEPPSNGSWYIGMASDLQFSVDSLTVNFGDLTDLNYLTAASTTILYATTSYSNGYNVKAYASYDGRLRLDDSNYIERWDYANTTPDFWNGTCWQNNECGFGYTTSDTSLYNPSSQEYDNRFATSTKYAGFATSTPGDRVSDSTAAVSGATTTITYKVSAPQDKIPGTYQTIVYYLCTVNY